ncbi:phosphotransferase family protein [Bacillus sp. 2205SS5-2]|uniref:phosphotransferase family protein n=1 Tax=Bacillus sp. 2205SS5-2 TaxID=3109031 RepID=UPI0030053AB6
MEHLFDHEWEITPAGGATGEAFFAQREEQKLFLKRNSSPFLAVLSAEGIVPKLIWTKRLENGDVITAQQWLNGRELIAEEMKQDKVAKLLNKIHSTKPLLSMLQRLQVEPFRPEQMLSEIETNLESEVVHLPIVKEAIEFLQQEIKQIHNEEFVVCHGDVNHNNWLLSDYNQLYLIDWDGAMIADPAVDLGPLLYWYIPVEEWEVWLQQYGLKLTDSLLLRMKWYVVSQTLLSVQWHKTKSRFHEMNHWIEYLHRIL